ncbi:hypothetical protein BBO99_00002773 [Phytophthora kernoviae]|uniref:Uncharacterized protein n=2 Tax=Phytophthora kernoviae TaxID=325452 RepID=A0A3R7HZD6_9STRA|nr:hypothetical protein G195_003683 [Phytophthora kernoviae 00238/432]KAG2528317.1 hypothetical protein JM16_001311 [Phytophthora kernoviae]KAG2529492.1 hypothetical protein JM18_002750 [Phytophthora kernoviae]RLN02077.1 hypothetical protein BBI17_003547 [Phytophthora kernoviae]RLN82636.1 hypothetical protein BBO99_00002773 [Phytophthora kernoviae]
MRKEQVVILGFGVTLVGVAGVMGIYLPQYSTMAQRGRERTARYNGREEKEEEATEKTASSMWKNMDKKKRGE